MEVEEQNNLPFYHRFWVYQAERFPVVGHGLIITAFTFSAVSYSRICRGVEGFISISDFFIGVFATITLFLLVRIFDEFKDKEDDAKYRQYLPVPRGLVTLTELKKIGWCIAIIQILVIAIFQLQMLWLYLLVIGYLLLMAVEFFVPQWLKKRQILYITSHMFIIPLIDIYSSGLDWLLADDQPHWGLAWFFAVSYMNGLVLEFGRKLKTKNAEEEGVVSYTKLYGEKGGVLAWMALIFATMLLAMGAAHYAALGGLAYVVFLSFFAVALIPGFLFLKSPSMQSAKWIEHASAGWTLLMYLALGGVPMVSSWF